MLHYKPGARSLVVLRMPGVRIDASLLAVGHYALRKLNRDDIVRLRHIAAVRWGHAAGCAKTPPDVRL